MDSDLFLTQEEIVTLTGYKSSTKQIDVLRRQGVPFRLNGRGRPIITRAAILGDTNKAKPTQKTSVWQPHVLV